VRLRREKNVPVDFPGFLLNSLSVKAFNTLFNATYRNAKDVVVDYDRYFYPLDRILQWNRMYGKRGFVQYQATLPAESGGGLVQLLERLSATGRASFLAVLKCLGPGNPGLLSHPMAGYTLTLDIPNKSGLHAFLQELDRIGIIDKRDVIDGTVIRMPKTYPAYLGTYDRFPVVREYLDRIENLFLIGRNGMHRYNNQDHSMLTAMVAVDNIVNGMTDKSNIWSVNTEQEYHEEKGEETQNSS